MSFGSGGFGGFGQQNQSSGFGFGANAANTNTTQGFGSGTSGFGSNANTGAGLFGNTASTGFGANPGTASEYALLDSIASSHLVVVLAQPVLAASARSLHLVRRHQPAVAFLELRQPRLAPLDLVVAAGFGSTTTTSTTPFGGGGASLFGASKPAFGSTAPTGGLFGSTATPATTGFGSTGGGFGAAANPGIGTNVGDPPGTAAVAFQPYVEKENSSNQQNSFQSVLFMDAYKKWSIEELRLVDYNQGRRYGNSTGTGAFGVSSNFGGFGSNNNTNTTTTTNTAGGLFGSGTTTTGFGSQPAATTGGFGTNTSTSGGLFGAKPAATGGLFGNTTAQPAQSGGLFGSGGGSGGFGSGTTSGFGSANTTAGTGLFGNAAAQPKPATGFGFGSNTQTTGAFGNTGTTNTFGTANTGATANTGGLFGSTPTNTATTGGGLFGSAAPPATSAGGFGTGAGGGFGVQNTQAGGLFGQAKPATSGLFGTATANTAAPGASGGMFGSTATSSPFGANNNTQSTFLQKPAATTGGGLFGNATAQPAGGGGLFGNAGQNAQPQQQAQPGSLFGGSMNQTQPKQSLFGSPAPAATGSLFGGQMNNQQQTGNAFGQSTAVQQQGGGLGGSLFGNSTQGLGGLGATQGLTTSISDAGAYGAPSLFQNLATAEVHNPGPLATPLSLNKSKTSRRSSILPLYKMNPGSASKFATPQKRGYGFSYSTLGTPNSASSMSSTPGAFSQSLLVGGAGRALSQSISSSSLRRTLNADDSILLPGAFSTSSGSRFYGSVGSSKKLVINRDMRSDLFSTPTKVKEPSNDSSDSLAPGSARKLQKRVSFDTTVAKDNGGENGRANGSANGNSADLGYLRPQGRSVNNGAATATSSEPEMTQISGKELAVVHEEEYSPANRCIPDDYTINSKDLGEYWMSPSKEEIDRMNRIQRQQVANFTVGRVNVGQVRFRVPVDLTKISLDSIPGGIVTLIIRSATVYPDINTKPPVGQGLNVPAEIMLLHTCPRSGPDVSAAKMKKHIMRLRSIPDTSFVDYDEKTAAWTFTVEHFTTYGFDEDEDDETDAETTIVSAAAAGANGSATIASPASGVRTAGSDDDSSDARRRKRPFVPGAFNEQTEMSDDEDNRTEEMSFLSSRSAEMSSLAVVPAASTTHDLDMEPTQDGLMETEHEASLSRQPYSAAEHDNDSLQDSPPAPGLVPVIPETPAGVVRARMRAIKESSTPIKLQVADGDNWMEMLQKTVSPQKRDRAALKALSGLNVDNKPDFRESKVGFDNKVGRASISARSRLVNDNRGFATSIDLMNSLFEKAKAPPAKAPPKAITTAKGFMKWPYNRQNRAADEDEANMEPTERAFHESMKPAWSADGSCIVIDEQGNGSFEPTLKRLRVFDSLDPTLAFDPLEGIAEHKEAIDIELVNGVPSVSTRRVPPIKTFAGFCEQANRRRAANAGLLAKQQGSYEQSVWELASVLFDPVDGLLDTADETRARKENLSRFWAQLVQDATTKSLEQAQSLEEKAVVYLAGRKVPEACRALVDSKNFKAATLTSLIGTSNAFRKDMREQMEDWQQGDVLAEFSVPIRSLYSLLAGNVSVCEGKKGGGVENRVNSVVLSEWFGLDWKQAFGLRLWYGIAAGEGIETAVAKFVEDLEQGRVPQPRPWYANQRDVPVTWAVPVSAVREDLLFGLLKVAAGHARLEDVLEPESSQASPLRFRLCWQINQALSAAGNIADSAKLSPAKADMLTSQYAAEVVYSDSREVGDNGWIHAVWVLMHLSDPTSRVQAIQDVLGRHAGRLFEGNRSGQPAGTSLYERLVDDLKMPAAWVWQASALYWRYEQKQPALEAECLLHALAFADAHSIFVKELAPKAIVERNYGEIAQILSKLQPHRHQISGWALGGEVYSRFLDLLTLQRNGTLEDRDNESSSNSTTRRTRGQQQQARAGAEQASVQLSGAVEALVSSLPAMYENAGDDRPTEVAAITEMADVVAKETMALASKGRMDLSKISRLPLTEDRRLRYSNDLAFAYYREVMAAQ
ncbi:nucleoporin nup189 [Grosmannia clavigera kw1407]|uniref:Nucleoporin nup189 n=1 Tax=Grosmannia clavigera (strain kw1407 / UAMH 11150) TaxID=655863 RepID=F0XBY7_GROCL|nr:nucleoporin nup189 [Grosmannia clavigera kw1407]EFX03785.1 nucleoporin nup189 [Grosmannia clavigera kw1407]